MAARQNIMAVKRNDSCAAFTQMYTPTGNGNRIHTHTHIHIHIHSYMHTHTHTPVYTYTHTHICTQHSVVAIIMHTRVEPHISHQRNDTIVLYALTGRYKD